MFLTTKCTQHTKKEVKKEGVFFFRVIRVFRGLKALK